MYDPFQPGYAEGGVETASGVLPRLLDRQQPSLLHGTIRNS
jgi:hypothetical protein